MRCGCCCRSRTGCEVTTLPCPFCGSAAVEVREASTYRWCACHCCDCGAIGSEIRVRDIAPTGTPYSERDRAAVVAEWNRRAAT